MPFQKIRSGQINNLSIQTYANTASLPASETSGQLAYVLSNNQAYIYNNGWFALLVEEPYWNNVMFLLTGQGVNGSTYALDSGPRFITTTRNGTYTLRTTKGSPFSASDTSIYLNGSSYIYSSGYVFDLPNSFTVEGWFYFDSFTPASPHLFQFSTGSSRAVVFRDTGASNKLAFYSYISGVTRYFSSTSIPVTGQWYHIALTYDGTTLRLFIGGALEGSLAMTAPMLPSPNSVALSIGYENVTNNASSYVNGYISNFRITRDVARYTSAFTPPTRAFSRSGP